MTKLDTVSGFLHHRVVSRARLEFLLSALVSASCLPQVGPPIGGEDAGLSDAGSHAHDAGPACGNAMKDALESDVDCGGPCPGCATNAACGTARDCAQGVCLSARCAAPASVCRAAFSGCTAFVDLTDAGAPTIRFPVGGDRYSPDCVRVRLGQTVTFSGGDFSAHPLDQACGPVAALISARSGAQLAVTFSSGLGVYGFFCDQHGTASGSGMAGAIEVVR
ncbi:MAG: hypothetical protein Q8L14_13430 [Myxococcales bacterium]|nr:hypothetical protein [Myxococcales bacterium]